MPKAGALRRSTRYRGRRHRISSPPRARREAVHPTAAARFEQRTTAPKAGRWSRLCAHPCPRRRSVPTGRREAMRPARAPHCRQPMRALPTACLPGDQPHWHRHSPHRSKPMAWRAAARRGSAPRSPWTVTRPAGWAIAGTAGVSVSSAPACDGSTVAAVGDGLSGWATAGTIVASTVMAADADGPAGGAAAASVAAGPRLDDGDSGVARLRIFSPAGGLRAHLVGNNHGQHGQPGLAESARTR